jgi:IS30 family transposase
MEKLRRRLTLNERIVIETLLNENRSKSYIAIQLKRNRSTITREVNNWVRKPSDKYDATIADFFAKEEYLNKRNKDKISTYKRLKAFIYRRLLSGFSPEQIAGRIKVLHPNDTTMSISHEAIYQHIYKHRQSYLGKKLIKLLPYHHHKRREKRKFGKNRVRIKDQVNISQRPKHVELRIEVGHWEGDLMIGTGQKSAIGTIVERKTRYTFIVKIENRKSKTVTQQFAKLLNTLPKNIRKTMTYDNGIEMANHKWLSNNTGMDIYFANPYSSWERGTNENTNGLIRRFFPKGTDFNKITIEQLKQAQFALNNRPRKILGYKTPNEIMNQEITNYAA